MKFLKELLLIVESDVARSTAAAVYHRDYLKTKRKKYRKYDPKKREQLKEGRISFPAGYSTEELKQMLQDGLKDVKVIQQHYPDELDELETFIDEIKAELQKRKTTVKEAKAPKDVKNLKVGDGVCFKYDIEQCSRIEKVINQGWGGKQYVVRAFHGGYVDNIDGTLITLDPSDCWIE